MAPPMTITACLAAAFLVGPAVAAPMRVVSMNLCTDQLAMMLASPGQLISISYLARDARASNLAEEARAYEVNSGAAEEIYLMAPDLVLTGEFTNQASVDLLTRLGIRVEVVTSANTLDEVSDRIRQIGALLDRADTAEAMVADYEAALADLADRARSLPQDRAAYYYPNNYTSGSDTLGDEVLDRAGFDNVAVDLGLQGAAKLPLEVLVMERPFLVRSTNISGTTVGRAYATLSHPALRALETGGRSAAIAERWQVCGTPFLSRAIARLISARRGSTGSAPRTGE